VLKIFLMRKSLLSLVADAYQDPSDACSFIYVKFFYVWCGCSFVYSLWLAGALIENSHMLWTHTRIRGTLICNSN
jgi:hypothetical protein